MPRLWLGLRALLFPHRVERELDAELQFHLDMHAAQLMERGMSEAEARDAARRAFGNRTRHREGAREARYLAWLEALLRDAGFAARGLRRRPVFATVTIGVLALGISANTTIFSAVNAVLLEAPPYDEPDRLAFVWQTNQVAPGRFQVPAPDVADYRNHTDLFDAVAFVANPADRVLQSGDRADHARVGVATPNLFDVLGVGAAVGRTFLPDEAQIATADLADTSFVVPPSVAMLSHGTWAARFGSDSSIVGRSMLLGGRPVTIVGVLPAEFTLRTPPDAGFPTTVDVWTPLRIDVGQFRRVGARRRSDQDSDNTGLVIARLAPAVTFARAQAGMDAVAASHRAAIPSYADAGVGIAVVPLQDDLVAHARPTLFALQSAVALVLLIACVNVATLLAARGSSRRQELAVRTALGAGRGRLVRQFLVEALVIAGVAATIALAVTAFSLNGVTAIAATALPSHTVIQLDWRVFAFTLAATLIAALLSGVVPAIVSSVTRVSDALRDRSSTGDLFRSRIGRGLVVSQLALAVALLAGASLLLKSFAELSRVEPGFDPDGLVVFSLNLESADIGGPGSRAALVRDLEARVRDLPGIEAIGLTNSIPLSGIEWSQPFGLDGQPEDEWERNSADFRMVTSEYFAAMGIDIVSGRNFTTDEDLNERERIAIVDRTFARRVDPTGAVVGKRIGFPLDGSSIVAEVVGVVDDVRHTSLQSGGRGTIYVPYRQEASRRVAMAVRTTRDVPSLTADLQRTLRTLDATVLVFDFKPMTANMNAAMAPTRFVLTLVAGFAVLAVILAASGLYGLLSFAVHQRTRELGVRLALGSSVNDLVRLVVRGGMVLVAAGLAIGVPVSIVTSRALNQLLYGVSPADPLVLMGVMVLLTLVGVVACYIPARRASRIDPMTALRAEG